MKKDVPITKMKKSVSFFRSISLAVIFLLVASIAFAQTTVVDIVVNSTDHTTLEAAVIAAGLDDDLSGEGPFTVFAPTDDAFSALPEGLVDSLLLDPTGDLAEILLYHVVGSQIISTDLADGQVVTTLNGDSITITFQDGSFYVDDAKITGTDIHAGNGVVHVIDAVITPYSTVVDVIVGSADHNTLEAAVIAAELADDLSGDGPFTVFAPTDAAFAALPEGTVETLLMDPTGDLADILLYHVVGGKALSTDLSDGQMITTLNGADVTVSISEGDVYINEAKVIAADIETDNGVVHVIDAVMIPTSTSVEPRLIDEASVTIYPNPARDHFKVRYELEEASEVRLELFDIVGQKVRQVNAGYTYEGSNTAEFPVSDLESGNYVLIIKAGNSQHANKVRIVK